jgi:hypothetical protein
MCGVDSSLTVMSNSGRCLQITQAPRVTRFLSGSNEEKSGLVDQWVADAALPLRRTTWSETEKPLIPRGFSINGPQKLPCATYSSMGVTASGLGRAAIRCLG